MTDALHSLRAIQDDFRDHARRFPNLFHVFVEEPRSLGTLGPARYEAWTRWPETWPDLRGKLLINAHLSAKRILFIDTAYPFRDFYLGDDAGLPALRDLAGLTLDTIQAAGITIPFTREHGCLPRERCDEYEAAYWLRLVHWLAWEQHCGSPLRGVPRVCHAGEAWPLGCVFSELPFNVFRSSALALDLILNGVEARTPTDVPKEDGPLATSIKLLARSHTSMKLVEYLAGRTNQSATLDEIAIDLHGTRPARALSRRKTMRKQYERARGSLEHGDAPHRLSIDNNTVQLVCVRPDATRMSCQM